MNDYAIGNVIYTVVGAARQITTLNLVIGDAVIRTEVKGATLYMYNSTTHRTGARSYRLLVQVMVISLGCLRLEDVFLLPFR